MAKIHIVLEDTEVPGQYRVMASVSGLPESADEHSAAVEMFEEILELINESTEGFSPSIYSHH